MNKEAMIKELENSVQANGNEIIEACKLYLLAKAMEDDIKERAEAIQTKVLSENVYLSNMERVEKLNESARKNGLSRRMKQERITRPFDSYMMTDEDFSDYLEKCYKLYLKEGIAHPKGKGYIPEAPAQETRREAENYLLDVFEKVMPSVISHEEYENMRSHWKYRDKLIELALDTLKLECFKEA